LTALVLSVMVYPMRSLARRVPADAIVPFLLAIPPTVGYGAGGLDWCLPLGGGMAVALAVWSPWHSRRVRRDLFRRERIVITHADGAQVVLDPPPYSIKERAR
jgi:hypothetical protein